VSVGHLSPRKGFQYIVEALPQLPADTHLVVVGGPGPEGDTGGELQRRATELGIESRVHLVGSRPHAEVARWMNAADCYILASSYEGCPNVLLEALATGTPTVASRVGEVERFVGEGQNGFLFSSEDVESLVSALRRALEHPWDRSAIRESMVARGWDRVADEVRSVFRLALHQETPRS
jgi:glycosyltransferase involved in cell wall biosynthesis